MARKRKLSIFFWIIKLFFLVAVVLACNLWITVSTQGRIYDSVDEIQGKPVGLVLGTSKKVAPNTPNQHFVNRITAAAKLLAAGKVDHLLLSGYRDSEYYDETRDMAAKLKELGVPETEFSTDDEGNRTISSVSRAATEFGYREFIIISDDFHVARALFIADRLGLDAIALRSKSVDFDDSKRVRLREYFARVKAVMDVFLLTLEKKGDLQVVSGRGDS